MMCLRPHCSAFWQHHSVMATPHISVSSVTLATTGWTQSFVFVAVTI